MNNTKEKCKNCQELYNGSIIKVDENSNCVFCGRKVGGFLGKKYKAISFWHDNKNPEEIDLSNLIH